MICGNFASIINRLWPETKRILSHWPAGRLIVQEFGEKKGKEERRRWKRKKGEKSCKFWEHRLRQAINLLVRILLIEGGLVHLVHLFASRPFFPGHPWRQSRSHKRNTHVRRFRSRYWLRSVIRDFKRPIKIPRWPTSLSRSMPYHRPSQDLVYRSLDPILLFYSSQRNSTRLVSSRLVSLRRSRQRAGSSIRKYLIWPVKKRWFSEYLTEFLRLPGNLTLPSFGGMEITDARLNPG